MQEGVNNTRIEKKTEFRPNWTLNHTAFKLEIYSLTNLNTFFVNTHRLFFLTIGGEALG